MLAKYLPITLLALPLSVYASSMTVTDCDGNVVLVETAGASDSIPLVAKITSIAGVPAENGEVIMENAALPSDKKIAARISRGEARFSGVRGDATWKMCTTQTGAKIDSVTVAKERSGLSSVGLFGSVAAAAGGIVSVALANGGSSDSAPEATNGVASAKPVSSAGTRRPSAGTSAATAKQPATDCVTCLRAEANDCLNDRDATPLSPFQ